MPDEKARALAIQQHYYGKPFELAQYLILISKTEPGVVYEVFVILDAYSTLEVGCLFLDGADVHGLVQTKKGLILSAALHKWLTSIRIPFNKPLPCSNNAFKLLSLETAIKTANPKEEQTSEPIKLSQMEMDWYANYNQGPEVMWNLKNGAWNKNGPRVNFDSNICWDLPSSGIGFVAYNVDDLKGKRGDKWGYDQIGTKETIDAMINLAREWHRIHPDRPLQFGDISRPGGINTPDHGTHMTGKAFDMRLLRNDRNTGGFSYTDKGIYSRELTKEFILLVVRLYPGTTVYFNDPELYRIDPETRDFVDPSDSTHNNHLHVMFPGGKE